MVMRRMILAYRSLHRAHQQLLNKYKALSERERSSLRPAIAALEEQMDEMARKISEEAGKRYPAYDRIADELGIRGNASAMEALAELVVYLDPTRGFRRAANLAGCLSQPAGKRRVTVELLEGRYRGLRPPLTEYRLSS